MEKAGEEEWESSIEEVLIVGSKRKSSEDVRQHPVKKAVGNPSSSTYKSPAKSTPHDSDRDSVASKKKPLSRLKERVFRGRRMLSP